LLFHYQSTTVTTIIMFARDLFNLHRQVNSLFNTMVSQFADDWMDIDRPFQSSLYQYPRLTEGQQQQQGQQVQVKDESALRGRESEALTSRGKTEQGGLLAPLFTNQLPSLLSMSLDVNASDDAYTISCDLPGVEKQSIDIEADKSTSTLTIKAEKKQEVTEAEPTPSTSTTTQGQELSKISETGTAVRRPRVLRSERMYGMVQRSLRLANDADLDHISAKYENGVLKLTVPRLKQQQEAKQAKKIAVQ
jgi:HSP20 family protein